jgi:hypothetical protein
MTDPTPPGGAGEALAKRLEAEAERLQDAWRDLRLDAASWREASDMTGGPTSVALMRDALENERLAADKESTAELLREAAALLTEQSRQQEAWQPIETAPKDEDVDVLLYVPGERALSIGHWEPEAYATPGDEDSHIPEGWWGHLLWPVDGPQPTHWMPLPAPPQPKEPR